MLRWCFLLLTAASGVLCHPLQEDSASVGGAVTSELDRPASEGAPNVSLADLASGDATLSLQLRYRERKKQERLTAIQAQILGRLRLGRQPNGSTPRLPAEEQRRRLALVLQRVQPATHDERAPDAALRRLQSFYPACSLPAHTDRDAWEASDAFRLFYDLPLDRRPHATVLMAKLRLFKTPGADHGWHQSSLPRHNLLDSLVNVRAANDINVSIYQYVKPIKQNRKEKRRLLDTRTLPLDFEGWAELDVSGAVGAWLRGSRNLGLAVEVEDAFGRRLDAHRHFRQLNCSAGEAAPDPPFPNMLELHPEMLANESSLFDSETFPTLDLQTAETDDYLMTHDGDDHLISKRDSGTPCSSETLFVSFEEMEEHVIWPKGVHWTFCEGRCWTEGAGRFLRVEEGRKRIQRAIQTQENSLKSKCAASRYEPLTIVHYDSRLSATVTTVLEDLIPSQCSCSLT